MRKVLAALVVAGFALAFLFPATPEAKRRDRDRDGLSDRFELRRSHTNPRKKDTDRDGLGDRFEVRRSKTNPRRKDTDRDGLRDRFELKRSRTNPRRKDTDKDGLRDGAEVKRWKTNPRKKDTDGDGFGDGLEVRRGSNPRDPLSVPRTQGPQFPPPVTWTCNRTATTAAELSAQWNAAQPGETVCLASGSYGTFRAGSKPGPVAVRPQPGASAAIRLNFQAAQNVLVQGLTIEGGDVEGSTRNVMVLNNRFTEQVVIDSDLPGANILFDGNTHVDISGVESRLAINGSATNVVVSNSLFQGGGSDGVRIAGPNSQIGPGNLFLNFDMVDSNHTDPIQFFSGLPGFVGNTRITGNYFDQSGNGDVVAYIAAWDGTSSNVIDNNVFRAVQGGSGGGHGVAYSIALYADRGSVIHNNTMERGTCNHNIRCGTIMLASKGGYPGGTGTVIRDNVMSTVGTGNGSTFTAHNNVTQRALAGAGNITATPAFVGPATSWHGFRLAAGSPGKGAASDGHDAGIR
jgi:hypothetical protein